MHRLAFSDCIFVGRNEERSPNAVVWTKPTSLQIVDNPDPIYMDAKSAFRPVRSKPLAFAAGAWAMEIEWGAKKALRVRCALWRRNEPRTRHLARATTRQWVNAACVAQGFGRGQGARRAWCGETRKASGATSLSRHLAAESGVC